MNSQDLENEDDFIIAGEFIEKLGNYMTKKEINKILRAQRNFFESEATLPVDYRIEALEKLRKAIVLYEDNIANAIKEDLGRSAFATYMCETGMVLSEIDFMIKHTKDYARDRRVYTPLAQMVAKSYVKASPYGSVLIMSPWNYPFLLAIDPLVDALAAGNTAVIKPSAYAPETSKLIKRIIEETFPPEYVSVVLGGRNENKLLMRTRFDYIFFTGSYNVGREVMSCASKNLIPITLELGGKSPCIVDSTADIKLAARRIVFGKFLNCGQTCVAPDFVYADETIADELIQELEKEIIRQFGYDPLNDPNWGKIVNKKHFDRLLGLMDKEKIVFGGNSDPESLKIEPTIMNNVSFHDPVMKEEIFGPILPVLTYYDADKMINTLRHKPDPLALYIFTRDRSLKKKVLNALQFGGGCVNDTIIQLATSEMGFGGVGQSGMGSYHGKAGFDTFTHYKSIVDKSNLVDLPFRYQPYTKFKEFFVRLFLH